MNDFLDNGFAASVVVNGVTYPTVENAYQAMRTLDPHIRLHKFIYCTPEEARRRGEEVPLRHDWSKNLQFNYLYDLMLQKFTRHPHLAEQLNQISNSDICTVQSGIISLFLIKIRNHLQKESTVSTNECKCQKKKSPYQQGYDVGTAWSIGQIIPSFDGLTEADPSSADNERVALWFAGLNDAIQQKFAPADHVVEDINNHLLLKLDTTLLRKCQDCLSSDKLKAIVYPLARLARGTDAIYPSNRGVAIGQLLVKLRMFDGASYDSKVIAAL